MIIEGIHVTEIEVAPRRRHAYQFTLDGATFYSLQLDRGHDRVCVLVSAPCEWGFHHEGFYPDDDVKRRALVAGSENLYAVITAFIRSRREAPPEQENQENIEC